MGAPFLNSDLQNYYDLLVPETLIPNNSDLNNYTTPGQYYTSNSASSQTIEHSPYTAGGFKLSVEATVTQNRIIQILKPGALSNSSMYYRIGINQSGWEFSDWEKLTTNADIVFLSGVDQVQFDCVNQAEYIKVVSNGIIYQLTADPTGIHYDKCENNVWSNIWHITN